MLILLLQLAWGQQRTISEVTPFLSKPFVGEHPVSGLYDHRPGRKENDHRQLTSWDDLTWGKAGHSAYDWPMKLGTEVLAAADGVVTLAADLGPAKCGERTASQDVRVRIRHEVDGRVFYTGYLHLSALEVKKGQRVRAGELIARSGNSGCSSGPHLHFVVLEQLAGLPRPRTVDPYGWDANRPDPSASLKFRHGEWLWLPGQAPLLFRPMGRSQHRAWGEVRITGFLGMAWQDDRHPNNEYVQLAIRRGGPKKVDLSGWAIRNRAGLVYGFPLGTKLQKGVPLRLYTGVGVDSADTLFWGRPAGVWVDEGDCVELIDARGDVVHTQHQGRREDGWCERSDGETGPRSR